MPSPTPRHWLPFPAQVVIALLAWAGTPADLRAACGDYVQILGGEPITHADPGGVPACDRQAPPAVPPIPSPSVPGAQTQVDAVLSTADPADPPATTARRGEPVPRTTPVTSLIFRPPRASD